MAFMLWNNFHFHYLDVFEFHCVFFSLLGDVSGVALFANISFHYGFVSAGIAVLDALCHKILI
jgi:hypothetical protein